MFPIIEARPEGSRGAAPQEFEKRFLEICAEHRHDGRALVFALIVHNFEQPEVYHMLQDDSYWRALDTISGNRITVFAFHAPAVPGQESNLSFWLDSPENPETRIRSIVHRYFDLGRQLNLPCLLFFQANEERVTDATVVRIKANRTEDAFVEVREVIRTVAQALSSVQDAYRGNDREMFNLVKGALDSLGFIRIAKRVMPLLPRLLAASRND